MADRINWQCPYCNRHATLGVGDRSFSRHVLSITNSLGRIGAFSFFSVCPNAECQKPTFKVNLWRVENEFRQGHGWNDIPVGDEPLHSWDLLPRGVAKVFPDYIPQSLRDDYTEACSIADLSPKAAATLCRRCLQGMIRDFWQVDTKSNRLWDEMKAVKDRLDPGTWESINAVKDLGNIGAHMEGDVNTIVDVEPQEATLLIEMIESLFEDWYIQREQRQKRNADLKAAAAAKKAHP